MLKFFSLKQIFPSHICLTLQLFNLASCIWNQNTKEQTKPLQIDKDKAWEHLQQRTLLKLTNTKKTEQHFCDGAQNRTQLHFGEPSNKHTQIQQRSNKPQSSPRERLTKIFH